MKPVGYWNKERRIHWLDAVLETQEDGWDTPLYTAPRELSDEEIAVLKEIIRISDRKHPLWDKAKELLKKK